MSPVPAASTDPAVELLALYDEALPEVFGYLLHRCSDRHDAEDLTAETFLAAAAAVRDKRRSEAEAGPMTVGWLIGVARHKLVDHWRRAEREQRNLRAIAALPVDAADPWEAQLDAALARQVLHELAPSYRSALTLRYVDDLTVPQTAAALGRTVHATESLLARARAAFRHSYEAIGGEQ